VSAVAPVLALDESAVSAGPLGLLVILLMLLATWLLVRNMNARLRRLPREFPDPDSPPAGRGDLPTLPPDDRPPL
jgi:hypothetical protein